MNFDNFFWLHDLPGTPRFDSFIHNDKNLVSRQQKWRTIHNPNKAMRVLHKRFLAWLESRHVPLPNATGSRKRMSPIKNVLRHQGNRYFYLLDIKDAYGSVDNIRLSALLCSLDARLQGQEESLEEFLAYNFLETLEGGLITGGVASPALWNHYAGILLDRPLKAICDQYGLVYTRYVDDITISSVEPIGKRKKRAIRNLFETVEFPTNHRKAKYYDLKQQAIVITGVGLEWKTRTFLPRHYVDRIEGLLHQAITKGGISRQRILGVMSVFWAVTNKNTMNQSEHRLVRRYYDALRAIPKHSTHL